YTTPEHSPNVYFEAIRDGEHLDQDGIPVPQGDPTAVPLPPADAIWADEEVMDVEWAHAIAPSANIDVVEVYHTESDDEIDTDLLDGAQIAGMLPNVSVVSMSWHAIDINGGNEYSYELNYDSNFTTQGVTYIAASGDRGSKADGGGPNLFGSP